MKHFNKLHLLIGKSTKALLLAVFLFAGFSVKAQTTITIGSGSTTTSYFPFYYLYEKGYSQTIYTAAELTGGGATATASVITKVRYLPTSSVGTQYWEDWEIYMTNTTKTNFSSTTDWVGGASLSKVFDGKIQSSTTANQWLEVTLDQPFFWDGSSNIVVAINQTTGDWGNNPSWASYTLAPSSGNKGIYAYRDGSSYDVFNPPTGTRNNTVAQIQLVVTPVPACSGAPNPGAIASPSTFGVCAGDAFSLSDTGSTLASGLTYQWQQRNPSGTGTWTNITGATALSLALPNGITSATDFRLIVNCGAQSATTNHVTATINPVSQCFCIPSFSSGCSFSDMVDDFALLGENGTSIIDLGTGCSSSAYDLRNLSTPPVELIRGKNYDAIITSGTSGDHAAAWIDFDNNGKFLALNERVGTAASVATALPGTILNISIPATADTGLHIMRVMVGYAGTVTDTNQYHPCNAGSSPRSYGEVHDYVVRIIPMPDCITSTLPTSFGISSDKDTLCQSGAIELNMDTSKTFSGLAYQWQKSSTGIGGWTNIGGLQTNLELSQPSVNASTWYRSVVYCYSNPVDTSNIVNIHVNDPSFSGSVQDVLQCGPGSTTLTAPVAAGYTANWYDAPTDGNLLHTGTTFTTTLSSDDTFYLAPATGPTVDTEITIGAGTLTTSNAVSPFYYLYGGYNTYYLLSQSELNAMGIFEGELTSLAFNVVSGGTSFQGFSMKMSSTTAATVDPFTLSYQTVVAPSTITTTSNSWNNFVFDAPFYWDGSSAVIVNICWSNNNSGSSINSSTVRADATGGTTTAATYSDNKTAVAMCNGTGATSSAGYTQRPQMKFGYKSGCEGPRQRMIVKVVPAGPSVDLGNDTAFCGGGSMTLNAGNPGKTFSWSTGASSQTISVNTPGTYHVTVTDANGCMDADTVTIINGTFPVPVLQDTVVKCIEDYRTLNAGNPGSSYVWSNGAFIQSIYVKDAGTYTVRITHPSGCAIMDTVELVSIPGPPVELGNDTIACPGDMITIDAGPNGTTYMWNTGDTGRYLYTTDTGMFIVTVAGSIGCISKDTMSITQAPVPTKNLTPNSIICIGDTVTLDAGNPGASYSWNTGANTRFIEITQGGRYIVTITNSLGCQTKDTADLVIMPSPDAFLGNDTALCEGPAYVLKPRNTDTTVSYLWNDNTTDRSMDIYASGVYYVTLTGANGCVSSDTIEIAVNPNPPAFDLGPDTAFCEGNHIMLHSGNLDTTATVLWSDNSTRLNMPAESSGNYFAIVTNQWGCSVSDTMHLEVWPLPKIDLPNDTTFCDGNSMKLTVPTLPGDSIRWSTGSRSNTITVNQNGRYTVRVESQYGCNNFDTIFVTVLPNPSTTGVYATYQALNKSYQFTAQNVSNATDYFWEFGDGITATIPAPVHTYSTPGVYYASLRLSNNCGDIISYVTVDFKDQTSGIDNLDVEHTVNLYPNPAKNIVWLENKGAGQMDHLVVYNMLGQIVYQSNVDNGQAHQLNVHSYASGMYTVKIVMNDGNSIQKKFQISR